VTVYTKRLATGTLTGAGDTAVFTAPVGSTTVLRDIRITSEASGSNVAGLYVAGSGVLFWAAATAAQQNFGIELRQVILPSEVIHINVGGGTWGYYLTGYELT
jgi:hypothetical protein